MRGAVVLKDILYVGYHHGIYEMYDEGIMNQIKEYVDVNDRIFLSYAELSNDENGKELEAHLRDVIKPRFGSEEVASHSELHIICEGACALFPNKLILKES